MNDEKIIQIKVCNWLRQNHPYIIFIANVNEQQCAVQWRSIKSKMGSIKGVSDLFFPQGNGLKKGLWLELKTEKGRPSKAQRDFLETMVCIGYDGAFSYGFEDAIAIIGEFFDIA